MAEHKYNVMIRNMQPGGIHCVPCDCVTELSNLAQKLRDRLDVVELKNTMLSFELKIAKSMYPEKMKMVEDTLISIDELADMKNQMKKQTNLLR